MIQVTYPDMRRELVEYLQRLADPKYQKQVWINGDSDGTVIHDELDYAVHYLYDDTALASLLNTLFLFAVLLIGFAFVGGGVWHYLPWSKGPIAHAFSLGVGAGLLAATIVYFV